MFTTYYNKKIKLTYHYTKKGSERYELFDLDKDPYEKNNIAGSSPELLSRMIKEMKVELTDSKALYATDKSGKELMPE